MEDLEDEDSVGVHGISRHYTLEAAYAGLVTLMVLDIFWQGRNLNLT